MSDGVAPEVLIAQAIFWILLPPVMFLRPKWAVLAWLIMGNIDATGPGSASSNTFGWINAAKGVGVPLVLCWRLRHIFGETLTTTPSWLWIALTAYASVATIWTPFPLAAVKLIGNMCGILLAIVVLEKAARAGLLNGRALAFFVTTTLILGIIQTYYFGGVLYGYDGADQPARFSGFIFAQQYAAILVAFFAVVLWQDQLSRPLRVVLSSAICLALILNGSRTWVIGAAFVLAVYCWAYFRRVSAVAAFVVASCFLGGLVLSNLQVWGDDILAGTSSRIVATLNAVLSGNDTAQRAGLRDLSFRFVVYDGVLEDLRSGTTQEILFGHGTSSGGTVSVKLFPAVYDVGHLDPNRTIHNEWLRALYEWGVLGLGLLTAVFVALIIGLVLHHRNARWKIPSSALLSFLPAFLVALSTENILAGAGNAVTISLALMIGLLWTPPPNTKAQATLRVRRAVTR